MGKIENNDVTLHDATSRHKALLVGNKDKKSTDSANR
jgi:hypothetical protein